MELVLSGTWHLEGSHTLSVYRKHGGYKAFQKALSMSGEDLVAEVKRSNLRGRGGAGFPAGIKWTFLPKDSKAPKYLVINADEGEPGTFKDRAILEKDPHRMLEGCLICAFALGLKATYVYIRGEFRRGPGKVVEDAIAEMYQAGLLGKNILKSGFDHDMFVHYGAGAYICGEETGLLESLEGKPGEPRLKPPFPAVVGLFGCPTIINNVETIACVPAIIERGGEWFASLGNEGGGGTKLYCVSGHVVKPGLFEAPGGITMREVIYEHAGGVRLGRQLKGVIPGGSSCPVLLPHEIDIPMDFESLRKVGSMMGTAGVIVFDDHTSVVELAARTAHFYHHESCGQCTPCREGSGWTERVLNDILAGRAKPADYELLLDICNNIEGNTICALGDALAMPIRSFLLKFEEEFRQHIQLGRFPGSRAGRGEVAGAGAATAAG
jgi:NADH-quinone oxidoreductase subunit F